MTTPEPGIYYDITPDEYFSWDAVSNSRLSLLARSPLHYQHGFSESTPAMRLGSLVHSGVLEPLSIARRYIFMPDYANHPDNTTAGGDRSFSRATKFVKQMEDQFRRLHHDKEIVSEDDYNLMVGIATALFQNRTARALLRDGKAEVSIVWDDAQTGLRCKARADWLRDGEMVDLKTTIDASSFEKAMARYAYHRQMAMYQRGLAALGIEVDPWIIAVEKSPPYGCRVAPVDPYALAVGNNELDRLLSQLQQCQELQEWPGYEDPAVWSVPDWYAEQAGQSDLSEWFESALVAGGDVA